jgi:hypothetical protein
MLRARVVLKDDNRRTCMYTGMMALVNGDCCYVEPQTWLFES